MELEEIYKKLEETEFAGMSVSKQTAGKIHLYWPDGRDGFWISKRRLTEGYYDKKEPYFDTVLNRWVEPGET
jgi:hypothetical protein